MEVSILNNTINDVLSNFIRHETITLTIRSHHCLIRKNIINLIKKKNIFYKPHTANENSNYKKEAIKELQNKLTCTTENAKIEY